MLTVALAAFKEALRKKIILIVAVLTVAYLAGLTCLTYYVFKDIKSRDSFDVFANAVGFISVLGFNFSTMLIAFTTIMASVGSISSDLESGVIYSIITRPIKRLEYVFGKFIGLCILIVPYTLILYTGIILINKYFDVPPLSNMGFVALSKGFVLFLLEPMALLTLCLFGSVIFRTMSNGIIAIAIYILGLVGSMMEQIASMTDSAALANWGIFISLLSPFDSVYRKMIETLFASTGMSLSYTSPLFLSKTTPSNAMLVYAVLYCVFFLALALHRFNKKDIA